MATFLLPTSPITSLDEYLATEPGGLGVAMALSNNLSPFLYGVAATDWISFGVAPAALLLVGIAACVVPARRVARTDPVQVLREI